MQNATLLPKKTRRSDSPASNDRSLTKDHKEHRDALIKDMIFISTYGVRLSTDPINKNSLTWDDFWHTIQAGIFAGLFAQLKWIMQEAALSATPTIVKLAMFWSISAIDIIKSIKLWFLYANQKHGLTGMLLLGIGLTAVFTAVGAFAAVMTTLEATGKFALTKIVLPIIFTVLVGSVFAIKAWGAIKHFAIGRDKETYTQVVRDQHKGHAWENFADVITMGGVGLGVVAMFLLPAIGLIATAPIWAPIVAPAIIAFGLLLKLSLKIFNFFKGPVETITFDTTKAETEPAAQAFGWSDKESKSQESSPESSLSFGARTASRASTNRSFDSESSIESDDANKTLLLSERNLPAFFHTKRRVKTMGESNTLGEQQAYLINEIDALARSAELGEKPKAFLEKLKGFVKDDKAVSIQSLLKNKTERNEAFEDSKHHESDMQDLAKAVTVFAHDRARVTDKEHYRDYEPAYSMQLA